MTKKLVVSGNVFSSSKKGKHFVNLPWVKRQINKKLGFDAYPGTLNLRLKNRMNVDKLRKLMGITITPKKGYCEGKCFTALIMGKVKGAVVLPSIPNYPVDVLEILAPVNLRKTLGLKDEDNVEIIIKLE